MRTLPVLSLLLSLFILGCSSRLDQTPTPSEPETSTEVVSSQNSTYLRDRYFANKDPYCKNLNLFGTDWPTEESMMAHANSFLEAHFGEEAPYFLSSIKDSLSENPDRELNSLCRYAEELYVAERQGVDGKSQNYRVYTVSGVDEQFEIGQVLIPFDGQVSLSTNLFDDSLGMVADWPQTDHEEWHFYKISTETNSIDQVELCERSQTGLQCEYQYEPEAAL